MVECAVEKTLKQAYELYKGDFVSLTVAAVIAAVGSIFVVTIAPLWFGIYLMALKCIRGEPVGYKDVLKGFDYFIVSWVLALIVGVSFLIGLVLLIIPGLAVLLFCMYSIPIVFTEGLGAVDSVKRSISLVKANFEYSIVLFIILGVVNMIGRALPPLFMLTYPYTAIALMLAAVKLPERPLDLS
jgi:uncharacterized membrane protein